MKPRMIGKTILISAVTLLSTVACAQENKALSKKHEKIIRQFSDVAHISPEDLSNTPSSEVVIFDVREPAEYEVSHMADAIHISPNMSADVFLSSYAEKAQGKTVVFYCSVGQRSSYLANKVQRKLMTNGTHAVYNLEGGLFKWHNEDRQLQSSPDILTSYIHPYNRYWGRMVNDNTTLRYKSQK